METRRASTRSWGTPASRAAQAALFGADDACLDKWAREFESEAGSYHSARWLLLGFPDSATTRREEAAELLTDPASQLGFAATWFLHYGDVARASSSLRRVYDAELSVLEECSAALLEVLMKRYPPIGRRSGEPETVAAPPGDTR